MQAEIKKMKTKKMKTKKIKSRLMKVVMMKVMKMKVMKMKMMKMKMMKMMRKVFSQMMMVKKNNLKNMEKSQLLSVLRIKRKFF